MPVECFETFSFSLRFGSILQKRDSLMLFKKIMLTWDAPRKAWMHKTSPKTPQKFQQAFFFSTRDHVHSESDVGKDVRSRTESEPSDQALLRAFTSIQVPVVLQLTHKIGFGG